MISNDFVIIVGLRVLLIMKRIINLIVDVNENKEIIILSLSVLNDCLIISFKSNAFKAAAIFNEFFFKIEIKLNRSLIFFSIIICFF